MSRENIKIDDPNFTSDGVYFYTLSYTYQALQAKTDDGDTAFSYPCDTPIESTVNSLEWDGVYFWSLEDKSGGGGIVIRKWAIDSFILKQVNSFTLSDGGGHVYDANDFAIESYCLSVGDNGADGINPPFTYGLSSVKVSDNSVFDAGDTVTFVRRLTPTAQRYGTSLVESKVVNSVDGDGVTLHFGSGNSMTQGVYGDNGGFRGPSATFGASDPAPPDFVYVTKNIWLLNNNAPGDSSTGALYRINPSNGTVIVAYSGAQYENINSAGFYSKYNVSGTFPYEYNTTLYSTDQYLLFAKSSNLLFFNVNSFTVTKSLTLEGISKIVGGTWTVYDLAVSGFEPNVSVYRLQQGTTYDGNDENWTSGYSYEKTLLRRIVSSIAVTIIPSILPADNVSQAQVVATVTDQYGEAVASKSVVWADDGTGSIVGSNPSTSNTFGKAYTIYQAGNTEEDVKITATISDGLV